MCTLIHHNMRTNNLNVCGCYVQNWLHYCFLLTLLWHSQHQLTYTSCWTVLYDSIYPTAVLLDHAWGILSITGLYTVCQQSDMMLRRQILSANELFLTTLNKLPNSIMGDCCNKSTLNKLPNSITGDCCNKWQLRSIVNCFFWISMYLKEKTVTRQPWQPVCESHAVLYRARKWYSCTTT